MYTSAGKQWSIYLSRDGGSDASYAHAGLCVRYTGTVMIGCTSGEPQNSCVDPLRDTLRAVQLQEGVEGVKTTIII